MCITLNRFAGEEMAQRWRPDKHILAEFPLLKVYYLTLVEIDAQLLGLLVNNKAKTMANVLIVEEVLEETQLLSKFLQEILVLTSGDLIRMSRLNSLHCIKRFNNTEELNLLRWVLPVNDLVYLCMYIGSRISKTFEVLTHGGNLSSLHSFGKVIRRTQSFSVKTNSTTWS